MARIYPIRAYSNMTEPPPPYTGTPYYSISNQFTRASSQKFSIASNASLALGNFTFYYAGWAYFDAINVQQTILCKGDALSAGGVEFAIWMNASGNLRAGVSDGSTLTTAALTGGISTGTWVFIEGFYDSTTDRVNCRINRSTSISTAQTVGAQITGKALNFGSSGTADYFGGRLDNWAYYNTLPTDAVRDELYNAGVGKNYAGLSASAKTGLVSYWGFDSATGDLTDYHSTNEMTASVSHPTIDEGALGPDNVAITSPLSYTVRQRSGSNRADIPITGTFVGDPFSIQARFNNGAWKTVSVSPADGTFTGTLTNQVAGQGNLEVRHSDNVAITGTKANIGIGDIFLIMGQSNASGRGVNNQAYTHATLKAGLFGNDYLWKELADPVDSNTNIVDTISTDSSTPAGSYWPLVATGILASTGLPVAFVPAPKGNTSISVHMPGADPLDRATLFGSAMYRSQYVGGIRGVVWHQGEGDVGRTQAAYFADFEVIANKINEVLGVKIMPCKFQFSPSLPSGGQTTINNAIGQAWSSNPNTLTGPDLSVLTADNNDGQNVHIQTDVNLQAAADLWIPAIKTAYGFP